MIPRHGGLVAPIVAIVCIALAISPIVGIGAGSAFGDAPTSVLADESVTWTTADENLTAQRTHWSGQQLYATADAGSAGDVYQIRNYSDGDFGGLVTEFQLDQNGSVVIDTTDLDEGAYVIVDDTKTPRVPRDGNLSPTADASEAWWELVDQDLAAQAREHAFGEPLHVDISSNRGRYNVTVTSPELNGTDLQSLLADEQPSEQIDTETVRIAASADTDLRFDLADLVPGRYELRFAIPDTGVTETVTFTRSEPEEVANVDREVIQSTHGSVPTIQVNLQDTDSSEITVAGEDADYRTSFTVVDGNGDGTVEIQMNTYLAGWAADEATAFEPVNDADEIRDVSRETSRRDASLPVGDYEITVSVDGEETDLATLVLSEHYIGEISTQIATDADLAADPSQIRRVTMPAESVAMEDAVVFHVEADALEGMLAGGYDLAPESPDARTHQAFLELEPVNGTDGTNLHLSAGTTLPDSEGGVYFVLPVETETVGFEPGTTYEATFRILEANPLVNEEFSTSTNVTVEPREVRFDGREGDVVALSAPEEGILPGGDVLVSGNTSVAPGTELVVVLRSEDPLIVKDQTAVVTSDREWEAEFEIPDDAANFTVHVRDGPDTISDHVLAKEVEPRESQTIESPGGNDDGETDENDELAVHPVLLGLAAALATGWVLLRFRDGITARVQAPGAEEPNEQGSDSGDLTSRDGRSPWE